MILFIRACRPLAIGFCPCGLSAYNLTATCTHRAPKKNLHGVNPDIRIYNSCDTILGMAKALKI
jgi:hypothetical protein